jgi:TRAP-type C4-dicarboxylate transport system permease small subunit
MIERFRAVGGWLHRRAENIAVLMLVVMFAAFIVQIASRYVFNLPVGGASELTITTWLWVVLWGAAFVLRERDEIRFDVIYGVVGPRARRVMTLIATAGLLFLYGYSLPAVWDYVTFMKVQKSSYLDIRYDRLYSIYIIFVTAILIRYAWLFLAALRGRELADVQRGDGQA